MPIVLLVLLTAVLLVVGWHLYTNVPAVPAGSDGGWGAGTAAADPRVAVAAMMHAIASEDGALTPREEDLILGLLTSRLGIDRGLAKMCLASGRRLDFKLKGNLNTRLHKMVEPIEKKCSLEEKRDVAEMLRLVAGPEGSRIGNVRDGLGRITAKLLHG